jgi:peptidyl-prolyl cis-trans isomerase D
VLKKLRQKKTAKKIWIILAIIIVPAFVFWGFGGALRSRKSSPYVGKLFGRNIPTQEFDDALQGVKNYAILQYGDKFSEASKLLDFESEALDRILLLEEARKRNIKVSDAEVIEKIREYGIFRRKGVFDNDVYNMMLREYFHTPPRVFEEQVRQNLMLVKLFTGMTGDVTLSEDEIRQGYEKENIQVNLYYIASLFSETEKEISISEEELKDYFDKNPLEFKQPVSFNLEYVSLASDDQNEVKEKIGGLIQRLNKNADFSASAKEFGLQVKETGLFAQTDPIPNIGWVPQILNYLFKASPGEYLRPLQIDKSYYIFRIKERKNPYIPEFQDIKEKVKQAFVKIKSRELAKQRINTCLEKLKESSQKKPKDVDFDRIAKLCGLKSATTGEFKYGSYIEGIGASDIFWLTARKLKDTGVSEIIETPTGYYIIKLKSQTAIDEKKFEEEKKDFTRQLLNEKKVDRFNAFLADYKRKLQLQ